MKLSFSSGCSIRVQSLRILPEIKPTVWRPIWAHMDSVTHRYTQKDKVIVIMGATGTGKSRLSIELATRFFPSEIINSDKIQVYRGLDITTNKIPITERLGVPHHLLGEFDPDSELTPSEFRFHAAASVSAISARSKLPLIVGGSNSFINALVSERFESDSNEFGSLGFISSELRYNCCFLWVDVAFPVLCEYLCRRVDDMFDAGMFEELAEFYKSETESISISKPTESTGLRKAIGVPEFDSYFRCFPPGGGGSGSISSSSGVGGGGGTRGRTMNTNLEKDLFDEAVKAIKYNTCQLAKKQMRKIQWLRSSGWDLRRLNATEAFRAVLVSDSGVSSEIWETEIVEPSVKIVKQFLE